MTQHDAEKMAVQAAATGVVEEDCFGVSYDGDAPECKACPSKDECSATFSAKTMPEVTEKEEEEEAPRSKMSKSTQKKMESPMKAEKKVTEKKVTEKKAEAEKKVEKKLSPYSEEQRAKLKEQASWISAIPLSENPKPVGPEKKLLALIQEEFGEETTIVPHSYIEARYLTVKGPGFPVRTTLRATLKGIGVDKHYSRMWTGEPEHVCDGLKLCYVKPVVEKESTKATPKTSPVKDAPAKTTPVKATPPKKSVPTKTTPVKATPKTSTKTTPVKGDAPKKGVPAKAAKKR